MSLSFSSILAFLIGFFGLTLMVLVHEIGHFIAAKFFKIRVESLSIGFGPSLVQKNIGSTVFKLCAIPFGGACKMAGKNDLDQALKNKDTQIFECEEGSIYSVHPLKRALTYLAGPLANIVFSLICYTILLSASSLVSYVPSRITLTKDIAQYAQQDCPAYDAGLRTGDTILSINNTAVFEFQDVQALLNEAHGDAFVTIETDRGTYKLEGQVDSFGILPHSKSYRKQAGKPLFESLRIALKECINEIAMFSDTVFSLFEGKTKASESLASTFIASENIGLETERGFKAGFSAGIRIVTFILGKVSISLAIANLLPIPALDGGLILVSLAELIVGHRFSPKAYIMLQVVGLVLVFIGIPLIRILY